MLHHLRVGYGYAEGSLVALAELINRVTVALVFWRSGMAKWSSWSSTEYLFQYEYRVPLLPWEMAAVLATVAELVLPVLLIVGVFARSAGAALFMVNLVAYISYAHVLNERPIGGLDHQIWGVMLLIVAIRGAGWLSLDGAWQWWRQS